MDMRFLAAIMLVLFLFNIMDMRFLTAIMLVLFLIYIFVELGWGGGDPNHEDHNPSGGYGGGTN